jgi:hypothetical protein
MRPIMSGTGKLALILFALSSPSWGQAAASATQAGLDYTLRYAEIGGLGGTEGTWVNSTPSGELHFINGKGRVPFEMQNYAGYTKTLSGSSGWDGPFVHTNLQGGFVGRHWSASANGEVNYRAQFATTGFSGVPGSGEPIAGQPPVGDSILMPNSYMLQYSTGAQAERNLTGASQLIGGFNTRQIRYPDGNGLESTVYNSSGQFTHRLNARNNVTFQYMHTQFGYPSIPTLKIYAEVVTASYERFWTRKLKTTAAGGPEFVRSTFPFLVPSSHSFVANASLLYSLHSGEVSLSFERTTTSGSGYYTGAFVNSALGDYSRGVGRAITFEMTGGYRQNTSLGAMKASVASEFGAFQIYRHIGRRASFFVNYTVISQSSSLPATPDVLSQVLHSISVGTEFSNRAWRAGH